MNKIILTNHLKERISQRKISESDVFEAINNPDSETKKGDSLEFRKKYAKQTLTAVTKINENNEYVVVSAWIDPPNPGTTDEKKRSRYFETKRASGFRKFWLTLLTQIGG